MTIEELTLEAVVVLRRLIDNPSPVEDSSLLQMLLTDRLVMGTPDKIHLTGSGKRLLAAKAALVSED